MDEIGPVRGEDFVKRLILAEILVRRGEPGPLARPRFPAAPLPGPRVGSSSAPRKREP